jgi:hypothetical protein
MAIQRRIIASGQSPNFALQVIGDTANNLAATGTGSTSSGALQLGSINNDFVTVTSGTACACIIPTDMVSIGDEILVYNGGTGALKVFGLTGDSINNGAVNASFSVAANKTAFFTRTTSTLVRALLSA